MNIWPFLFPPLIKIFLLLKALLVKIFTITSNLVLWLYPHTVAGLKIVEQKLLPDSFSKISSHNALYFE